MEESTTTDLSVSFLIVTVIIIDQYYRLEDSNVFKCRNFGEDGDIIEHGNIYYSMADYYICINPFHTNIA